MADIRRILVAVKNPGAATLPGVAKAAQLAQALGAELTLFHAIPTPLSLGEDVGMLPQVLNDLDANMRSACEADLAPIAQRLRGHGVTVSISAQWDHPTDQAILHEAQRIGADLIVAEAHAHGHRGAGLLRLTDWELLRHSPVPVLLVKTPTPYRRPQILVALDPDHTFDKPPSLDAEIMAVGESVCGALRGVLHAVHAFDPVPLGVAAKGTVSVAEIAAAQQSAAARAAQKLARAVAAAVPATNQHVVGRHIPDAIEQVAAQCRSAMVIVGDVARSGLHRVLIGNTAERVLDHLACDILVVKAPRAVPATACAARR